MGVLAGDNLPSESFPEPFQNVICSMSYLLFLVLFASISLLVMSYFSLMYSKSFYFIYTFFGNSLLLNACSNNQRREIALEC